MEGYVIMSLPNRACLIIDDFLDTSLIDEAHDTILSDAKQEKEFDPFFIKKEDINPSGDCISKILYKTWIDNLEIDADRVLGFEVWNNLMAPSCVLDLHVDCDEYIHQTHNQIVNPLYTSVLYLGPKNELVGGELSLSLKYTFGDLDKNLNYDLIAIEGENATNGEDWLKIPYRYNRLVVFDSTRPHLVTKIKEGATEENPRIGLTMAAWDYEVKILQKY
tara:strand:+ start:713 stop:1372 length:660 start_codon:yes stop_codon:yes gene_type:complete